MTLETLRSWPRKVKKKKIARIKAKGLVGKQSFAGFSFHQCSLCKVLVIATKVGIVRHKGPRKNRGSGFKNKPCATDKATLSR